ncbi:MAG: hypothetical protein Q4B67_04905 [Eubacteriales bacterium]|nr:hypothetical protein [Eubacteriales bacterium]
MERKVSYYVSRKNAFTWLTVLAMLASLIVRLVFARAAGAGVLKDYTFWLVTMPVIASVWFVLIILINGDEKLYKTAIPFGMFMLYFFIEKLLGADSLKTKILYGVLYMATGIFYTEVVSGKIGKRIVLWIVLIISYAFKAWDLANTYYGYSFSTVYAALPDVLMIVSVILLMFAMRIHLDGKYHPTWGDRIDGRRVRTLGVVTQVSAYIMPTRQDASNHIQDSIDMTKIDEYLAEKKAQGYKNINITHVFLAAYVKAVAKYPALNRFLAGQKVYSRGNDIQFCMVVKNSMTVEGEDSVIKLHLTPYDTIFDIYEKLDAEIDRVKKKPIGDSDFDKIAKLFSYIPGPLLTILVAIIRIMDYFGLLPAFLLEVSPFHASIFFTSMASLGIEPIVHHLYDFGNLPVFCSFGSKYAVNELQKDGTVVKKKYINYTFNTDERIADGFYYASVFKYVKKLLNHLEKLEVPASEVNQDVP